MAKKSKRPRSSVEAVVEGGGHFEEIVPNSDAFLNYELSWLAFNRRVLWEACQPGRNLLLDRVRFLSITASNLDEFFQKRVGALKKQVRAGVSALTVDGMTPQQQLAKVRIAVESMAASMSALWLELMPELEANGVCVRRYAQLSSAQKACSRRYFEDELFPLLTPLAVDPGHPFPFLSNLSFSVGALLKEKRGPTHFARVKVPLARPRFMELPCDDESKADGRIFVPVEDIIAANLQDLFPGMKVVSHFFFRVTRSAAIEENHAEAEDLMEMISEELRNRRYAPIVRVETDSELPDMVRSMFIEELEVAHSDIYVGDGMLGLASLSQLAGLRGVSHLSRPRWTPRHHPRLVRADNKVGEVDFFALLRQGELLAHFPYHSFDSSVVAFIRQAARDPKVLAIKQTLYRTTEDAESLMALVEAAELGKQVAVLVELKARFDEERNIELAQQLEESGVHVAYGVVGLKTHCKVTLVVREEESGIRTYFHVGTGNYNAITAKLYEDIGLFSSDPVMGLDLLRLFNFLTGFAPDQVYRKLLVSPQYCRSRLEALIGAEEANAEAGRKASIIFKCNGLEDPILINRLYRASQKGVQIDLIVRGVCRLIPGKPGLSENIRVRSIVGRFLEHSRLYCFHGGGDSKVYIGSADLMRRNLDWRVEVLAPIEAKELKEYILHYLEVQLNDKHQSWIMAPDGSYSPPKAPQDEQSCHELMMATASKKLKPIPWAPFNGKRDPA